MSRTKPRNVENSSKITRFQLKDVRKNDFASMDLHAIVQPLRTSLQTAPCFRFSQRNLTSLLS